MTHRLAPDISVVVVILRDLAFVGKIDPVALEDVLHLKGEQVFIGEDIAAAPKYAGFMIIQHRGGEQMIEVTGLVDIADMASLPQEAALRRGPCNDVDTRGVDATAVRAVGVLPVTPRRACAVR